MTPEEFRALIAKHKGVAGHEIVDKPKDEAIGGVKTGDTLPTPNPRIKYVLADGTHITARQMDDGQYEIVDPGTAMRETTDKAPETRTFPDGSLRERQADGTWKTIAEKPSSDAKAPTTRKRADGGTDQWNPETKKWESIENAPPKDAALPGVDLGARRPGQRTDLSLVQQQANAYVAQLNADVQAGRITRDQRQSMWDAYVQKNVKPAKDQADAEANAEMDAARQRQAQADARASRSEDLANRREDRLTTTDERRARTDEDRLTLERQKFAQTAGQDAVETARKVSAAQLGSGQFGQHLADFLSGGAGTMPHFTAEDLRHYEPDYQKIAEDAARRALDSIGYRPPAAPTAAPVAAAAPAPVAPPPTAPVAAAPGRPGPPQPVAAPPPDSPQPIPGLPF